MNSLNDVTCPNCDNKVESNDECPVCGFDLLSEKTEATPTGPEMSDPRQIRMDRYRIVLAVLIGILLTVSIFQGSVEFF